MMLNMMLQPSVNDKKNTAVDPPSNLRKDKVDAPKDGTKFKDILKSVKNPEAGNAKEPAVKETEVKTENIEKKVEDFFENNNNEQLHDKIKSIIEKIKILLSEMKNGNKKAEKNTGIENTDLLSFINDILTQLSDIMKNSVHDQRNLIKKLDIYNKILDEIKETMDFGKKENNSSIIRNDENKDMNKYAHNYRKEPENKNNGEKVKIVDNRTENSMKEQLKNDKPDENLQKPTINKNILKIDKKDIIEKSTELKTEKNIGNIIQKTVEADIDAGIKQKNNIIFDIKQNDQVHTAIVRQYSGFTSSVSKANLEAMMQNITGRALITLKDGKSELKMNLIPPELGKMNMKFSLEDGQLVGKIVVSTPEAKMLFDQNLGDLQRALQQAGINLTQLDVSFGQRGTGGQENSPQPSDAAFNSVINDTAAADAADVFDGGSLIESSINYLV